jgi:hypothetical protein
MIQLGTEPDSFRENGFRKSSASETAEQSPVSEILNVLAAASLLVEDSRRELRRGRVAERTGSVSWSTE